MQFEGDLIEYPGSMRRWSKIVAILGTIIVPIGIGVSTGIGDTDRANGISILIMIGISAVVLGILVWILNRGRRGKIRITESEIELTDRAGKTVRQKYRVSDLECIGVTKHYHMMNQDPKISWRSAIGVTSWSKIEFTQNGHTERVDFAITSDYQRHLLDKIIREWRKHEMVALETIR